MSGKKTAKYLIPLVVIGVIALLGILMGLFSWRNMAHNQDFHTQDCQQDANKIAEAIAVVEQYNLMKQEAAEIPGIWAKKADWEKVVSRRVNTASTGDGGSRRVFFKWALHVVG